MNERSRASLESRRSAHGNAPSNGDDQAVVSSFRALLSAYQVVSIVCEEACGYIRVAYMTGCYSRIPKQFDECFILIHSPSVFRATER